MQSATTKVRAHYVSQVLLKQFAVGGMVSLEEIATGSTYLAKPKDIAFMLHEDRIIRPAEDKWSQEVEVLAKPIFKALKRGDLLTHPELVARAKLLITLHYVRSAGFYSLQGRLASTKFNELVSSLVFRHGMKLTPENLESVQNKWASVVQEMTPESLMKLFNDVRDFVAQYDLEIAVAPQGSRFILADNPVITMTNGGRIGVQNGVRIDDSDAVGMPFGPGHLVALKRKATASHFVPITAGEVNAANQRIRSLAINFVVHKPAKSVSRN